MTARAGAPDAAAQLAGLLFAVLLIDETGVIAEANFAAEELLGRSAQRLVGRPLFDILSIEDERVGGNLREADMPLIARGIIIGPSTHQRCVNLTRSPINSHLGWSVVTLSDVGHVDFSADEDRAELCAPVVLAHEIKNPLSAIRGASQLLERRADARDKPLARMISAEVDRIANLINRMQQLGAKANATHGPCNPHQAIRNAIATIRAGRPEAAEMVEAFDPSLPLVQADQGVLEQILINLIANACDASEGLEMAMVTVRTRFAGGLMFNAIHQGKATRLPIEISITDAGPGIAPELRDHVFEPFISGKPHGQGLGLALVRKLLRDMGGRVAYERDEHAGLTHFRINLPVASQEGG